MKIITQKELASLAEDAFKNAEKHGFYTDHIHNIDLMEHIKLKMQYNESRPYLHGCKY